MGSIVESYKHVSNSLALIASGHSSPSEVEDEDEDEPGDYTDPDPDPEEMSVVVAKDGSGNFSRVQEAVDFAPNNSEYRVFVYVKRGVYEENVEIPSYKTNVVLLGEGKDVTFITGNRSVADGWTTFRSATVGNFSLFHILFDFVFV